MERSNNGKAISPHCQHALILYKQFAGNLQEQPYVTCNNRQQVGLKKVYMSVFLGSCRVICKRAGWLLPQLSCCCHAVSSASRYPGAAGRLCNRTCFGNMAYTVVSGCNGVA